jgi:hypothetical protein
MRRSDLKRITGMKLKGAYKATKTSAATEYIFKYNLYRKPIEPASK